MTEAPPLLPGAETMPVAVMTCDSHLESAQLNRAWRALAGPSRGHEGDADALRMFDPRDHRRVRDCVKAALSGAEEVTVEVRGHQPEQWVELRAARLDEGELERVVVVALDVSSHKHREAVATFAAVHDALTGLHGRAALFQHIQSALDRLRREPAILAVLYIDLNEFGSVNEQYGHGAGDRALKLVARRLRQEIRPADLLARVGGDEFVAVCESMHTAEEALAVARRLIHSLEPPIELASSEFHISAAIGIAFARGPKEDVAALIDRADRAMYRVKRGSGDAIHVEGPDSVFLEAASPSVSNGYLSSTVERLARVEGDAAEGWADSLTSLDKALSERWRNACYHVGEAMAALRDASGVEEHNGRGKAITTQEPSSQREAKT